MHYLIYINLSMYHYIHIHIDINYHCYYCCYHCYCYYCYHFNLIINIIKNLSMIIVHVIDHLMNNYFFICIFRIIISGYDNGNSLIIF
jgi:hypothetical protein